MRVIFDTDVIIAGLRSPTGASSALLSLARHNQFSLLASVPLFMEYEAKCLLPEHYKIAGLTPKQVQTFLDTLAAIVEPVEIHYLWRPQLRDAADEMVLEAAVNGRADVLISFNHRHFGRVPSQFGIELLLPAEFIRRLK